jgi:hypothetical protein
MMDVPHASNRPREQPKFEFIYGNLFHVRVFKMAIFNEKSFRLFSSSIRRFRYKTAGLAVKNQSFYFVGYFMRYDPRNGPELFFPQ